MDPNLRNPWGMAYSKTSPIWVSNQITGNTTVYNAAGGTAIPPVTIPSGDPTGQVFTSAGSGAFPGGPGGPGEIFLFSTLSGTVAGWHPSQGSTAITLFAATDGAEHTGLALGSSGSTPYLYAADNHNNKIDVLNSNFALTSLGGTFVDPLVPAGFAPYNIQNINGSLYVTYSLEDSGTGYIGVFDTNGSLLRHVSDASLNEPWGLTLAPAGFGQFGGDLLVGNVDDGLIHAFDPNTGAFLGTLSTSSGDPIANPGLWGIGFRESGSTFNPNALYFVAGINDETDGLFGNIQVTPEPATLVLIGLPLAAGALWKRRRWKAQV
jgi:uncharacterized protein (TIGR03118 family)